MEKLQLHKIHIPLFPLLLFLLHFFSLQFLSLAAYTPPTKYFINCGSDTNVNAALRNFVGDSNSSDLISTSVSLTGQSSPVKDSNPSPGASLLYQTARIFRHNSAYEFNIEDPGTYFVRLHFFAFSSPSTLTNLSTALFDVSASGFSLLLNFTPENNSNSPILKEFLLTINSRKFKLYFVPRGSSFAFINAIEVFLAPPDLIVDDAQHVSPAGLSNNNYKGVLSKTLQSIYRINVGGPTLTPDNELLWRNWVPDNGYIYNPSAAVDAPIHSGRPNYQGSVTEYTAPDLVYQTAKEMNIINSSSQSNLFNITWSFNVTKSAVHLVRFHFCDIISTSLATLTFNLYIYGNFSKKIDSYEHANQLAEPFYLDFVVDSDESGFMNISIGPRTDSDQINAFLNGLEIKEILTNNSGSVPTVSAPKNNHVSLVVGSVIGGLVLICILAVVLSLVFKSRKPKPAENSDWSPVPVFGGGSSHSRVTEGTVNGSLGANLNLGLKMPFAEIQSVTNNFDKKLLIGKGGFGIVYRGTLRDGKKVAVKRSEPGSNQGLPEFQTEIMILSKIRHRNLVQLIGYCDERSEMILVYEFMEKGTLRDHLYASDKPRLPWKQRLEICIGAARGLQYLHKGSAGGTIHRDVKSTNILLDENLVAKVADFGLSKTGPLDETHVSTVVKGTFGYLDPEYFKTQQLTEKSDVYSFGVVLLEVLCARPPIDPMLQREQVNLAEWAMIRKKKGLLEEIIDPLVKGQIDPNSLRKFIETTEKCLQESGTDRPNMSDVLWDLEYTLQLQQNAMGREPHEDSMTNSSVAFVMPNVQRFPSISMSFERDDTPILMDDSSYVKASEVFSQMRIDDAR
ncbi:probable receptor-like protein kinase At5g24010 [Alnus glutinosa]|uniref:probable receptor-like protein kinase At5g24010 n=1 Tax=Alnus glutinosa TaxID=3517 RepID=UPI002D77D3EF|nr:probable receptor-like protein kinase At5g24010 [Alnus glutinosa]